MTAAATDCSARSPEAGLSAANLTDAARDRAGTISFGVPLPLARAAEGHDHVDTGTRNRVLMAIPE
jgi:NADPH:quinone reductase